MDKNVNKPWPPIFLRAEFASFSEFLISIYWQKIKNGTKFTINLFFYLDIGKLDGDEMELFRKKIKDLKFILKNKKNLTRCVLRNDHIIRIIVLWINYVR